MEDTEFIIALTEHRFLGNVFIPYLIEKNGPYYTVKTHVKPRDFKSDSEYKFNKYEIELVNIIEKYSDERLVKRFSRTGSASEFYSTLNATYFQKHVSPFIEKCMFQVAEILMLSPVRLINKEAKYANLYDEDEIEVPPLFATPVFTFERNETETRYHLKVIHENQEISLQGQHIKVITNEPCMIVYRSQLLVFEALNSKKLQPFFEKNEVHVPHSIEEKYYKGFVLNAIKDYEVEAKGFKIVESGSEKIPELSLENNLQLQPAFVLRLKYGSDIFLPNSNRKIAVSVRKEGNSWIFKKTIRDFNWEKGILEYLHSLGLKEENGYFTLKGNQLFDSSESLYWIIDWLNKNNSALAKKGIHVVQEKLDKTFFTGDRKLELQTQGKRRLVRRICHCKVR